MCPAIYCLAASPFDCNLSTDRTKAEVMAQKPIKARIYEELAVVLENGRDIKDLKEVINI